MINQNDYIPAGKTGKGGGGGGPFLARVVSHLDPTYMGMLEVEILRPVGNSGSNAEGQLHQVKMMTPFYGATSSEFIGKQDDYNNTQKSYGMWFVPPDVGTTVVIIFIDADPKRGYWIGCVPDEGMNFMVPGIAATQQTSDGEGRVPVAEYNKAVNGQKENPTVIPKPQHPFATALKVQGLLKDDIRGITTSSARREVPSMVFGISTPGPIDKRTNAKKGKVGKLEHKVDNVFVSRLGGTTFVMDDGDDKFIRKKPASSGPPEYSAVGQGETGGEPTIPHNELVRIRTRTGHQILLHNSEDLIYIGNARGTTWIELTSNGKIDIYAQDSVSVHTATDLNVTADRDINFSADRNVNISATGYIKMTSKGDMEFLSDKTLKMSSLDNASLKSGAKVKVSSGGSISLKGGAAIYGDSQVISWNKGKAEAADAATKAFLTDRVPMSEPWNGHENLDPAQYVRDKTAAKEKRTVLEDPLFFQQPTTITDPFMKVKGTFR